jgi:hypothetical protein
VIRTPAEEKELLQALAVLGVAGIKGLATLVGASKLKIVAGY